MTADLFAHLDAELWFVKRLKDHGKDVFLGDTTAEIRKERIRQAILERGCDVAIIGRSVNGKPETYSAAFERLFKEPLESKPKRRSA